MSYKVYKSQNYFVVHDTTTSTDVIRQVRNLVRWEKVGTLYSFYYNTPNLTTVGNAIVRLGSAYEFSTLVDSTGTAWASQSVLDLFLEQWTGHICCPIVGDDASYTLKNTDGTVLDVGTIASGGTADISAPDAHINIKKTGDVTIASIDIPSGTTENYEVANNAITVNGANDFEIKATDPLDIVLTDGTSTVTPDSVTYNAGTHEAEIVLPATTTPTPRSTATLMKTGQTVSYATNDDGATQRGRATNFTTLDLAPLHNDGSPTLNTTTNRLTDILGGQTYSNNIVLDWSTWDGSTLLGYRRTISFDSYANIQTEYNALNISGFTGWKIPNVDEMFSICNKLSTLSAYMNYSPFSISTNSSFYTSTLSSSTVGFIITNVSRDISLQSLLASRMAIPVRIFNLSTSNVLS